MFKSDKFLNHARRVIRKIDAAVSVVKSGETEKLSKLFKELGAKHASFGLKEEHYDVVGQSILFALEKALGDDFTPEVKDAWADLYGKIKEHMMQGEKQ